MKRRGLVILAFLLGAGIQPAWALVYSGDTTTRLDRVEQQTRSIQASQVRIEAKLAALTAPSTTQPTPTTVAPTTTSTTTTAASTTTTQPSTTTSTRPTTIGPTVPPTVAPTTVAPPPAASGVGARIPKPSPRGFGVAQPPGAIVIKPTDDAARIINQNPVSSTWWFAPGTHVLKATIDAQTGEAFLGAPGSIVQVGTLEQAIRGAVGVNNVTVRGLTIDGGAAVDQRGTVEAFGGSGWLIDRNEIRNGRAFGVFAGRTTTVSGNYIHDNGQGGVKGWADGGANGIVVSGNEIAANNTRHVNVDWEAGGFKLVEGGSATISGNWFHDNWGRAIWFDYALGNNQVVDNTIAREYLGAIEYEASGPGSVIAYNTIIGTGWSADGQTEGRNVQSGAVYVFSAPVEIHHNLGIDNRGTVGFLQKPRNNPALDPYLHSVQGSSVHDNVWNVHTGTRSVTGLLVDNNADWAPYPTFGQAYMDAFLLTTNTVSYARNTYTGLGPIAPSVNYWETGGWDQRFLWGYSSMGPTAAGTNADYWVKRFPTDGPFAPS